MEQDLKTATAALDCTLDGKPIELSRWPALSSKEMSRVVGDQSPSSELEHADVYGWSFESLAVSDLVKSMESGEEPVGGWSAAYARHLANDLEAVAGGSPEYKGRDEWIKSTWLENTAIYPLFVVMENGAPRLWDGHRRLSGAFHYRLKSVFCLVGRSPWSIKKNLKGKP